MHLQAIVTVHIKQQAKIFRVKNQLLDSILSEAPSLILCSHEKSQDG